MTKRTSFMLAGMLLVPTFSHAALCTADDVPAATLLIPSFAVDLDACSSTEGLDTHVWITNAEPESILAHVTMWTEGSVPALGFDLYLTGFDVQELDLRDVLCDGDLPATGSAVSPHGPLSGASAAFASCNNSTTPGSGPLYPPGVIGASFRSHLHAWLTGQQSPVTGTCASPSRGDNVAPGDQTIDAAESCSVLFPTDPGYFGPSGVASHRNALVGRWALVGPGAGQVTVRPAIAIEADGSGSVFQPGDHTFYGRYLAGSAADRREPLPSLFGARFTGVPPFAGTGLTVWREASNDGSSWACASPPSWAPVAPATAVIFDEEENTVATLVEMPWESNSYGVTDDLANPYTAGWLWLDLRHSGVQDVYGDHRAQGWVAATSLQAGGARVAEHAFGLGDPCQPSGSFPAIFGNGFESGDTSAWSLTVP